MKYENLSTTSGFLYLKARSTTNAQHSAQINADSGIRAVSIGDDLIQISIGVWYTQRAPNGRGIVPFVDKGCTLTALYRTLRKKTSIDTAIGYTMKVVTSVIIPLSLQKNYSTVYA